MSVLPKVTDFHEEAAMQDKAEDLFGVSTQTVLIMLEILRREHKITAVMQQTVTEWLYGTSTADDIIADMFEYVKISLWAHEAMIGAESSRVAEVSGSSFDTANKYSGVY